MIGYVTLGTNKLPRAAAFYDALLAEIGAKRLMDYGRGYSYGESMGKPTLGIVTCTWRVSRRRAGYLARLAA